MSEIGVNSWRWS